MMKSKCTARCNKDLSLVNNALSNALTQVDPPSNPFYRLMFAVWLSSGRDNYKFLTEFLTDSSPEYANPHGDARSKTLVYELESNDFFSDVDLFFNVYDQFGIYELGEMTSWKSRVFNQLIIPVLCIHLVSKRHSAARALKYTHRIVHEQWRTQVETWLKIEDAKSDS